MARARPKEYQRRDNHLHNIEGRYAVRVPVPKELRGRGGLPRHVVQQYVGTGDLAEAKRKAPGIVADIEERFARARLGLPIADDQVRQIAEEAGRLCYDLLTARYLTDRDQLPKIANALGWAYMADIEAPNEFLGGATAAGFARQRLKRLSIEPTEESVDKIAASILRAQGNAVDALRQGIQLPPSPQAPRASRPTTRSGVPIISELADRYLRDRRTELTPKTIGECRTSFAMLAEAVGDVPFDQIERRQVAEYVTSLAESGLAAQTVNKRLSNVSAAWEWCQDHGFIPMDQPSPFTRLWRSVDHRATKRQPFTIEELSRLFVGVTFDAKPRKLDHATCMPWLMLCSLYSGLRLDELCNATIGREQGVRFLFVPGGKTESAERRVPLHPVLVKRGFLDYAKAVGRLPGGRLFLRSTTVSKAFTRYRRSRGVIRPKIVEHSFRHCFAGALDAIGLDSDRKAYLMGHSRSFTSERYGHGGELRGLARAVAKVKFKGLRLPA